MKKKKNEHGLSESREGVKIPVLMVILISDLMAEEKCSWINQIHSELIKRKQQNFEIMWRNEQSQQNIKSVLIY